MQGNASQDFEVHERPGTYIFYVRRAKGKNQNPAVATLQETARGVKAHIELNEGEEEYGGQGSGGAEGCDDGCRGVDELLGLIEERPGDEGAQENCHHLQHTKLCSISLWSFTGGMTAD